MFVEIRIRAPLEHIWDATQRPERHVRWDLRFTDITYLDRESAESPQMFEYATRIGFGLRIRGRGETVGSHEGEGARASSLRFWSDDPKSLIREGSGYWKYVAENDGVRFLTQYDYETRFGALGAIIDRVLFRPLIGWATAWSFDRLRLWLEEGIDPALSLFRSACALVTRMALALIWCYQGLVPKLLAMSSHELELLEGSGFAPGWEETALRLLGIGEIAFGLAFLFLFRVRALHVINVVGLLVLGLGALVAGPEVYLAPFNPASLTVAMIALSLIGLRAERHLASARRCARRPATEEVP